MEPEINFEPLLEYLTKAITPNELANLLDALAYDYLKMMIRIQMLQDETIDIHEEANSYIYNLKELLNVLKKCEV